MLVIDGFGHERDGQDEDAGENKQDDAEVEIVDSTYDGGAVAGAVTAACPINKFSNHPGQADGQANHEAVKSTLRKGESKMVSSDSKICIGKTKALQSMLVLL